MENLLNASEEILYYISPTGSHISVNDFKYYSKTQQNRCTPVFKNAKLKTRAEFHDKFFGIPISERLKLAKSVDLRDNYKFEDLGNGYGKVTAIDNSKTY